MMKSIQSLPMYRIRTITALFSVTGMILLLSFSNAMGQAGSKDSQKFQEYSDDAKGSFEDLKKEIGATLGLYNSLLAGQGKKPESTYKKLTQSIGKSEKAASKSGSSVDKMNKQAGKVFSAWEKELGGYQNEQLKELSVQRLDASKQRYNAMAEKMKSAIEACDPLMISFNEQAQFMAHDLSPEAMTALEGSAKELNGTAEELMAQIDAVLAAEPPADTAPGEAAPGDQEG